MSGNVDSYDGGEDGYFWWREAEARPVAGDLLDLATTGTKGSNKDEEGDKEGGGHPIII